MRDVQFCMSLVTITLPLLGNISGMNCGKLAPLCIVMSSAPMPQAGQWNTYSSTSHSTTRVWNLNPSVTLPVLAVNSGAAHTNSSALFLSEVSMVGTTPSIRTLSVMSAVQSHVLMPDASTTHSVGQSPLALDPFSAITSDKV